jgi:hypothetical protein
VAGVEDPGVVDVVTQKPTGGFELIMVESRPWTDPLAERVQQILAKIETYLSFAFDGQMAEMYPDSVGVGLSIRLDCVEEPGEDARAAIEKVAAAVERQGVQFVVSVLPPESPPS